MNQIYKKNEYIVVPFYRSKNKTEFMVINNKKKNIHGFKNSHTHLKSFEMAKYLINLSISNKINNGLSPYLLRSLVRISNNEDYITDLEQLISIKKQKGKKMSYRNRT